MPITIFRFRISRPRIPAFLALFTLVAMPFTGCTTDAPARDPVTLSDVAANTLRFWPPRAYALASDTLHAEILGLRRVYACATVDSVTLESSDAAGLRTLRLASRVTIPGRPDCPLSTGLDTVLEAVAAGTRVDLVHPDGRRADSLHLLTATATVTSIAHPAGDSATVSGRFTFLDSTAARPARLLVAQLDGCEVLEAAVWTRTPDGNQTIRLRTLAVTAPPANFPPCNGSWTDTVSVMEDRYGYP